MLNTVLIEDDIRDKEILENLLTTHCAGDIFIKGSAATIEEGYKLIITAKPDLVFLDVELGNGTGFDLLSRFNEFPFKVIFVTGHEQYAIRAIKFNALDYVLKPVDISELIRAVQKVKLSGLNPISEELKNLIHVLAHPAHKSNKVAIPVLNGYKMVAVEDIVHCEARKEYTYIHFVNQPSLCSSVNLGEYEELLRDYDFCRVHHSYLVNRDHVKQYIRGEGGELLMGNGSQLPVSRRKKTDVLDWLTGKM